MITSVLLKLAHGSTLTQTEQKSLKQASSALLLKTARSHVILIRTHEKLEYHRPDLYIEWLPQIEEEKQRIQKTLELIEKTQSICQQLNIPCIFTKSFQHYPDMGHDIDLFVPTRSTAIDEAIQKQLGATPLHNSLLNHISGKTGYQIPRFTSPIEIHHGRLGPLGDHVKFADLLVKRAVLKTFDRTSVLVPSQEDRLVLQAVQRVYGHFTLRISDILTSISLITSPELNLDSGLSTATHIGCRDGFICYLSAINQASKEAGIFLTLPAWTDFNHSLLITDTAYSFSKRRISTAYLFKYVSDLQNVRLRSVGLLTLLPFIAVWVLLRNQVNERRSANN